MPIWIGQNLVTQGARWRLDAAGDDDADKQLSNDKNLYDLKQPFRRRNFDMQ